MSGGHDPKWQHIYFFLCNIDLESLMDRSDHLNNKKLEKLGKQTVAMSINGKRAVQTDQYDLQ